MHMEPIVITTTSTQNFSLTPKFGPPYAFQALNGHSYHITWSNF